MTKQTVQFKLEDIIFFCQNAKGHLRQMPINALDEEILPEDRATLKLYNQKTIWKGVWGTQWRCKVQPNEGIVLSVFINTQKNEQ